LSGNELRATAAGTCVVTAKRAGDTAFTTTTSEATRVTFTFPRRPPVVTIVFNAKARTLTEGAKRTMLALARRLVVGATVTITSCAQGDAVLAEERARDVAQYLASIVAIRATIRTSAAPSDKVTIATTRQ